MKFYLGVVALLSVVLADADEINFKNETMFKIYHHEGKIGFYKEQSAVASYMLVQIYHDHNGVNSVTERNDSFNLFRSEEIVPGNRVAKIRGNNLTNLVDGNKYYLEQDHMLSDYVKISTFNETDKMYSHYWNEWKLYQLGYNGDIDKVLMAKAPKGNWFQFNREYIQRIMIKPWMMEPENEASLIFAMASWAVYRDWEKSFRLTDVVNATQVAMPELNDP